MPFQLILAQPRHSNQTAVHNNAAMITQELPVTGMAGHAIVTLLKRHQSIQRSRQTISFQHTHHQLRYMNLIAILLTILQSVAIQYLDSHAPGMAGDAIVIPPLEKNLSTLRSRQTMSFQLILAQPKHLTLLIVLDHLVANLPTILNCVVVICLERTVT